MTTTSLNTADWPATYPRDYVVVDVETTGLTARDRVISVAAVLLDAHGAVAGRWSSLVDPRRDPGPVHVHGLTAGDLAGQPLFEEIADELADLLTGRVVVAHNASFDWKMLDAEYRRLGRNVPAEERLCTVTLAKRLELPLPNWRLASLATHYGIRQLKAHDAEDDARVLSEAFRFALHEAARGDLPLPLTRPGARGVSRLPVQRSAPPKPPCPYVNPGAAHEGMLVQGMRVAFTGETRVPRETLEADAAAAGLCVTGSVSRKTSLLVTNDTESGTGKNRAAREKGVPVVDEAAFAAMLADVRPGVRVDVPVDTAPPPPSVAAAPQPPMADIPEVPVEARASGVLNVLVLHGRSEHAEAGRVRGLVAERGHRPRLNLTKSVDIVIVLPEGGSDPRAAKAAGLGITCLSAAAWEAKFVATGAAESTPPGADTAEGDRHVCRELPRGGVHDLPGAERPGLWTLQASWRWDRPDGEVDVVAFLLDASEKVRGDCDFVFWNQPATPDGGVSLEVMGSAEQGVTIDLDTIPSDVVRIAVAAVVDGTSAFDAVGPIEVQTGPFQAAAHTRSVLDAATVERVLLLGEFYRRGAGWRFRAQGQGYEFDAVELARRYGVDVES
ncbi:exonuclease domain-containing protein [Streptodolium elevatio]|uniref:Exonuclease domain-containing protein n=1 Tax=Streptodolium elevatio TaxID=3157996 RepID=A0ABV3DUG2_9ACTN